MVSDIIIIILTTNGGLPDGSGTTITHITQNNTAHKTTQAIKGPLHTINTMHIYTMH
jgi:hypothetical protein